MKSLKSILLIATMIFTAITAVLVVLVIFDVATAEETRQTIIKMAQACAVVVAATMVIFGISSLNKS